MYACTNIIWFVSTKILNKDSYHNQCTQTTYNCLTLSRSAEFVSSSVRASPVWCCSNFSAFSSNAAYVRNSCLSELAPPSKNETKTHFKTDAINLFEINHSSITGVLKICLRKHKIVAIYILLNFFCTVISNGIR